MPSKETRRQHYLPFVYLKYFRCDSSVSSRDKATIFRDDGKIIVEEKAANQCYTSWCYRRANTTESENTFQTFERDWDCSVVNARNDIDESALIFSQMVMYHFRNRSIQMIDSKRDRFSAVEGSVFSFMAQKILKLDKGVRFTDNSSHVTKFPWKVKLINVEHSMLLTSDNPSVMAITHLSREEYGPFFLPVSPSELLVAIDQSKYRFASNTANALDGFLANAYVAAQSIRHLYYSAPLNPNQRNDLWAFVKRNRATTHERGSFEHNRFKPGHTLYPENSGRIFSFLEELSG